MRKYVLALLVVIMTIVPSVAYADVTMDPVTEDEMIFVDSVDFFKAKNEELEKEFIEKYPELYGAFKKTMDTPYAFNMKVNVIAKFDYSEQEDQIFDFRRAVAKMSVNGYSNVPEESVEMSMDFDFDAGQMFQESFNGFKFIIKDQMMYLFDPIYEMWESEDLESSEVFDITGNPMKQQNLGIMAPLADLMSRRETADSVIYSLRMTEEDLKKLVDEYAGMSAYDEFLSGMQLSGVEFDLLEIEMDYVLKDGAIRVQHIEIPFNMTIDGMKSEVIIALDANYYSYGLQKEIVIPEIESEEEEL